MSLKYPHRANPDGTIDSICPRCYATIGSSVLEQNLEQPETTHVCDPSRLSYFEERAQPKPVKSEECPFEPERHCDASIGRRA